MVRIMSRLLMTIGSPILRGRIAGAIFGIFNFEKVEQMALSLRIQARSANPFGTIHP